MEKTRNGLFLKPKWQAKLVFFSPHALMFELKQLNPCIRLVCFPQAKSRTFHVHWSSSSFLSACFVHPNPGVVPPLSSPLPPRGSLVMGIQPFIKNNADRSLDSSRFIFLDCGRAAERRSLPVLPFPGVNGGSSATPHPDRASAYRLEDRPSRPLDRRRPLHVPETASMRHHNCLSYGSPPFGALRELSLSLTCLLLWGKVDNVSLV